MFVGYTIPGFYECCKRSVSSNFCRFYIGAQAHILIADLDMLKQIMVKDFANFSDHLVSGKSGLMTTLGVSPAFVLLCI